MFVLNYTDINFAYNYHSQRNYYIHPSYIPYNESQLKGNGNGAGAEAGSEYGSGMENKNFNNEKYFFYVYESFSNEKNIFPKYTSFGTTIDLLHYNVDGEASDWMLLESGIIPFTPELENHYFISENFFPKEKNVVIDILRENFSLAFFGTLKSNYVLKFNNIRQIYSTNYFNIKELEKIQKNNNNYYINNNDLYFWNTSKYVSDNQNSKNLVKMNLI